MTYGFIKEAVKRGQYVFGKQKLPQIVLQPDGQWIDHLPEYEAQAQNGWDTYACTIFGTINAIEILEARIYGVLNNYSERFHYNMIPVRPPGGSPHAAAESIRKNGMVAQNAYPMTETFEEYVLPEPVSLEIRAQGLEWLDKRAFGHEYLWSVPWWAFWRSEPTQEQKATLFKEALKYSPVGVSVTAWYDNGDGVYIDRGEANNHWCVMIGYEERADGTYFKIFDSYDHEVKILSPYHRIESAKRYHLDDARRVDYKIA